jgi:lipopolysaccharide assembly outer membrane protein LptD (OstA)
LRISSIKVFFILACLLITATNRASAYIFFQKAITPADTTIKNKTDTINENDNSFLNEKVTYWATDSMVIDQVHEKAYLYNNAVVVYGDMKLEAGYIELDYGKNMVYSRGIKDSLGNTVQKPVSTQGPDKFNAEEITYNFKTKKGKIKDVITQQGDGFIHGRDIKKDTNNVYYVANGKYTTCDLEHPHYYIGAKKIKVIPNDKIITGPAELWIADIPTPLAIPFGYFPNKKGRASGILLPTYGESTNLGFFLKDGGFYFGNNEKIDLALRGDVYSNGSFGLKGNTNYKLRYKYAGGVSISYSKIIDGDRELPNARFRNDFFIRWNHTQDPKSHPTSRFSANVNAGSSSYNKYNGSVTGDYLTNTFQSNISYSKSFTGTPFNFSANARHNQNTLTKKIDISLPELSLMMNRIYPFKSKNSTSNKWYDKIGLGVTANARNEISAYDSTLFTNKTIGQMRNGVRFTMPISTSFNLLKYFVVTPSINTASNIYFQTIQKHFDGTAVVTDTVTGAKMANDYSLSTGISTRLYGDYFFKSKHLKQIRHVASPTLTASYRPDFSESQYGYYHDVQTDVTGKTEQYSVFQNGIYGAPASGKSSIVGFNLNNSLEAKMRHKTDSGSVDKKVILIESFNVGFSYNMAVKDYNWSTINLNGRTKLFKKIDVNATAILNPYQMDSTGAPVERFEWANNRIGRLTNTGISVSTNLRSKEGNSNKPKTDNKATADELDYINAHPDAYVDFNVPWNLNIYYNINYSKAALIETTTQSATFNGDVSLTKKWKVSLSSGYDFTSKKLTLTSINVYRDLHCWEMHFTWVPFGFRQSFSLDINVKSAVLRDLKLSKRKDWYDFK